MSSLFLYCLTLSHLLHTIMSILSSYTIIYTSFVVCLFIDLWFVLVFISVLLQYVVDPFTNNL